MPRRRRQPPPEPRPGGAFHITRLDSQPAGKPEPTAPVQAPENVLAARYSRPGDALTFLAKFHAEAGHRHVPVHRAPDGAIWVIVYEYRPTDVELTWALGGVIYSPAGPDLLSPRGTRYGWADLQAWPPASLVELAAGIAPGADAAEQQEVVVVTTGTLARWVIDRFHSADLGIKVAVARLGALFRADADDAAEWAAVFIRVTGQGRAIPQSFSYAISGLPHTVVCRGGGGRLLVDQRLTLPLPDDELARSVPEGQEWLLAGDLGVWKIIERGAEHHPPLRASGTLRPPPAPPPGRLPPDLAVEVRLVRDEQRRPIDALLLDDDELAPLRRFLEGHPAGERAFIVLGPGAHLLAEPGRGLHDLPFGVPLHRIGPGALYQEVGYRLQPGLPGPARAALFHVNEESLVVLRATETHRLSLRATAPVWSLWLGPTVPADPGHGRLSPAAVAILKQVDAADARVEQPGLATDVPVAERAGLRTEGFLLEQQGKLVAAARKYWEAGEPALAAKLYELAAEADQ